MKITDEMNSADKNKKAAIDWADVHKQIEAAQKNFHASDELSTAEKNKILKERTKALAKVELQEEASGEHIEILLFTLANENYGLCLENISEVYHLKELTPLPCTPSYVKGLFNIRGQIQTVIDIREFFGLPPSGLGDLNKVIIVNAAGMELGILADIIVGAKTISSDDLQRSLPTISDKRADFLMGVTNEPMIIVLDIIKILSDEQIVVNEMV